MITKVSEMLDKTFLSAAFDGRRHQNRVSKIACS